MTPPPRNTRWGLIAASLAAAFGLSVGGAYAYDHFFDRESDSSTAPTAPEGRDSAGASETSGVPSVGGRIDTPTATPPRRGTSSPAPEYQYPEGRSEQYRLLAVLLNESSLHTVDPGGTIQQAKMVCESLGRGDDFATASNSTVARNDADGAVIRTVSAVVSVQMFCPQYSPVGDSRGAVVTPNNPDQDGEMVKRLGGVGLRISDLPSVYRVGRQVCSTLAGDPDNYPAAYSMVEGSGLGLDRLRSQFFTIIAHQAYCPSK